MSVQRNVLLLTEDGEAASAVAVALNHNRFAIERASSGMEAIAHRLRQSSFDAVLVDVAPSPRAMLEALEPVIRKFPGTPFVVLTGELSSECFQAAMRAGAKYCQGKTGILSELLDVIDCLAPEGLAACSRGKIVTVLSAGGGCGATTLAINLSDRLRESSGTPPLLVDLDATYGAVCEYLGLRPQYGVADVLAHAGRMDSQLVQSTVLAHATGLQVLASPVSTSFGSPTALRHEQLSSALEVFQQISPYTVIDAPRVGLEAAGTLAAASAVTLVVFQLNVKDVRFAQALLTALKQQGVPGDSLLAVANRSRNKHAMVKPADAQKVLGAAVFELATDYRSAIKSMNLGQMLSQCAPRSRLGRDIARLADRIRQVAEVPAK